MRRKIELMDTTLRDGEQTSGVAFTATEKLSIARLLLEEVKVDRLEVASARISEGEYEAVENIVKWAKKAGHIDKIEILGFVDGDKSLDWIKKSGANVINLLCKGSLNHVEKQLKKTPEEHVEGIKSSLTYAKELGIKVNVYLEDWSNGMISSPEYVDFLITELKDLNIERFMLPDTLGVLNPDTTFEFVKAIKSKFPTIHIDSHLHNDYDMAVGNSFSAIKAGIDGVHTTVNGLGERSGNTPLASVVGLKDHLDIQFSVDETKLNQISKIVEAYSGVTVPANKPLVGEYVFTQTCGVHADGDNKGNLYFNQLMPERFGRIREYALGKTSGNASIKKNLDELGITLSKEDLKKVTERVVALGDKKSTITQDDLPYIISDVLGSSKIVEKVKIKNYYSTHVFNLKPVTTIAIEINGKDYEETSTGDGQYDAFMKALGKIYESLDKELPKLENYKITIPPGGKTEALVETIITWSLDGREFKTRGLESDQQAAAIMATVKMLNIIE